MLSKSYTKYIQSLHLKKYRDLEGVFIAEGSKVVMDLLKSPKIVCKHLTGKMKWLQQHEGEVKSYYQGPMEQLADHELEKISALATPNQVLGIFEKMVNTPVSPVGTITLLLDDIRDPGNLGTILRIADWFGVGGVICSEHCADLYNPKVVQGSMGSLGRVPVLYTNLAAWLSNHSNIPSYAAALNGRDMESIKGVSEALLVIGNESRGICEELLSLAGERITIPKFGEAESLNAAVAAGIILSHMR